MRGFQVQHILNIQCKSSCPKEPSDLCEIKNLNPVGYITENRLEIHLKISLSFSVRGFLCLIQGVKIFLKPSKINTQQKTQARNSIYHSIFEG